MKVIYVDWLPKEVETEFNKEQFVYRNGNEGNLYLVTNKKYDDLQEKFNLSNLEEDGERLCFIHNSIEEWMDIEYTQEYYEFMGREYCMRDFSETTNDQITGMVDESQEIISFIDSDNWIDDLEKYMYAEISTYLLGTLRDALIKGKEKGLDISVLKMAFNNL